jgi:ankyrin repeat protein
MNLDTLPRVCAGAVYAFLELNDLFAIYHVARAFRSEFATPRPYHLAPPSAVDTIARTLTPLGLRLLRDLYGAALDPLTVGFAAIRAPEWADARFAWQSGADAWGLLLMACEQGNRTVAEWLLTIDELGFEIESARAILIRGACINGHLEMARWVAMSLPPLGDAEHAPAIHVDLGTMDVCAARGHLAEMQWLAAKCSLMRLEQWGWSALHEASKHGRLDVMQWLMADYGGALKAEDTNGTDAIHVLHHACINGRLAIAQWWDNQFQFSADDLLGMATLHTACVFGRLEVAQWLADRIDIAAWLLGNPTEPDYTFRGICENGHLETAQWFAERFNVTAAGARSEDNYALRQSCANDHLPVAQWLADRYELTAADLESTDDDNCLTHACQTGRLDVVQWLVRRSGLTAEAVRRDGNMALTLACINGHLPIAQWLTAQFGITRAELRASDDYIFGRTCAGGHLNVACWLMEFCFSRIEEDVVVRDTIRNGFANACANGHLTLAQWLATNYRLTLEEARRYNAAIRIACDSDHIRVVQWLVAHFGIEISPWHPSNEWAPNWEKLEKTAAWRWLKSQLPGE